MLLAMRAAPVQDEAFMAVGHTLQNLHHDTLHLRLGKGVGDVVNDARQVIFA